MKETPKIIDLETGRLLVVSDLHGNEEDYNRVWALYRQLQSEGKADCLIFLGDLVHRRKGEDASAFIIRDLIRKKANQPGSNLFALLGNHEMVHIYHIELWRGGYCYTEKFEDDILHDRTQYIDFFRSMPFAIRTSGGVLLNHTGPSGIIGTGKHPEYGIEKYKLLRDWSHEEILKEVSKPMFVEDPYEDLYPEIGERFMETPKGKFLWEFTMNKNERRYPEGYEKIVRQHLKFMSDGHKSGLNMMVNGHIQVRKGLEIVGPGQLRISSSFGAEANKDKTVLIFKAKKRFADTKELAEKRLFLYRNQAISSPSSA